MGRRGEARKCLIYEAICLRVRPQGFFYFYTSKIQNVQTLPKVCEITGETRIGSL